MIMKNLCTVCNFRKIEKRSLYCQTCYCRLLRQGKINKLEKPPLPNDFSLEQREIIEGSLLGDGCIFRYKPTHKPYFCVFRAAADDQYLIWEYEKLKNFCISAPKYQTTFDKRTDQEYHAIKFMTRRIDLLDNYYNLWYPSGKKIVPRSLELSPLSLAIWFCDDGCISQSNSPWRMRIKLATHGFDNNDVEFLQSLLQDRYGEKFPVIAENSDDNEKLFITGSDNAARAYLNEIDSIFPETMLRKAYWRNPEARFYTDQPKRTAVWGTK